MSPKLQSLLPHIRSSFAAAALGAATTGFGQSAPPAPDLPTDGETIELSPFSVNSQQQNGRYEVSAATSGGRVRVNLLDSVQSVSVITPELIEDTGASRVLDAAKYVSGITESTIPNGLDRITIRGFQTNGQTVDGFTSLSQANLDPVFIDRLEVVKGPNAILAPSGVPGGTINIVSRKPQFKDAGYVSGEIGLFDPDRAEIDVNRVFGASNNIAARVVMAGQDGTGKADNRTTSFSIMPMLRLRTKAGADVLFQFSYNTWRTQNYFGVPIDPSSGPETGARLLSVVPSRLNTAGLDYRSDRRPEFRFLLTTPLSESISMRLAARYTTFDYNTLQNLANTSTTGGAINPLTGLYTPGIAYGNAQQNFEPRPATPMPLTIGRGGTLLHDRVTQGDIQNDYVHQWSNDLAGFTTLVGVAATYYRNEDRINVTTVDPINYLAPTPVSDYTLGALSNRQNAVNYTWQTYVNERVSLFQERLTLDAGYSYNNFDLTVDDLRSGTDTVATTSTELISYGAVVKPIPSVSLYYGHSENASPQGVTSIAAGSPPLQEGEQDEYGVRFQFFNGKLFATIAYFDILQNNYSIPNPANLVVPPPVPILPALLADRTAKGWEYELRANLNDQISIIANATHFENRDPNDVPFRGTAEKSAAIWVNYKFPSTSRLSRLSIGIGANYLDERPGDSVSGVTAASTPDQVIPNQPTFWLPSRTLVDLNLNYRIDDHWRVQVNVDNLLDKEYLAASINRFTVFPGDPLNARLNVKYSF